jgi:hypothetical protein
VHDRPRWIHVDDFFVFANATAYFVYDDAERYGATTRAKVGSIASSIAHGISAAEVTLTRPGTRC